GRGSPPGARAPAHDRPRDGSPDGPGRRDAAHARALDSRHAVQARARRADANRTRVGRDPSEARMTAHRLILATAAALMLLSGCARVGRLQNVGPTVSPAPVSEAR